MMASSMVPQTPQAIQQRCPFSRGLSSLLYNFRHSPVPYTTTRSSRPTPSKASGAQQCQLRTWCLQQAFHMPHSTSNLRFQREKSHSGKPYNELADSLCTHFMENGSNGHRIIDKPPAHTWAITSPVYAQWAFSTCLPPSILCQYPVF